MEFLTASTYAANLNLYKSISTSLPVLDLIDAIAPNAVRQEMIKREDLSDEDKLNNAK